MANRQQALLEAVGATRRASNTRIAAATSSRSAWVPNIFHLPAASCSCNPNLLFCYISVPEITSVSPSQSDTTGGVVTINGNNFHTKDSDTLVQVWGKTMTCSGYTNVQLICALPALTTNPPTSGRTIFLRTALLEETTVPYNYAPPVVTGSPVANGPTAGGTIITIYGKNFAPASEAVVKLGTFVCTPDGSFTQTDTELRCISPAGQGFNLPITVTTRGLTSEAGSILFGYDIPVVSNLVTPSGKPTAGSVLITINGNNFGSASSTRFVSIAGKPCPISGTPTFTRITCTLPEGEGSGLPLVVNVDSQTNAQFSFSYDVPVTSGLTIGSASTEGSSNSPSTWLTITGSNFGSESATVRVNIGGTSTLSCGSCTRSHTHIDVRVPPGQGDGLAVNVFVESRRQDATLTFAYSPPSITSISPSVKSSGGVDSVIYGHNFGTVNPVVFVDSLEVSVASSTHTQVVFTVPAGSGSVGVVVQLFGQSSSPFELQYLDATITTINPTTVPSTDGGGSLSISGTSFGASSHPGTVKVGGRDCAITSWDHTLIVCTIPAGTGVSQSVVVSYANGVKTASQSLTYPPPTVSSILPKSASTVGGIDVTISGTNFGIGSDQVSVRGWLCLSDHI